MYKSWDVQKCTPLWREAHFQVKTLKNTANIGALLEVEMSKKCTPLWRKAHFQVKMYKASRVLKNCTPLWREAHFEVKSVKNLRVRSIFCLRCWTIAPRCGAKQITKSKCWKHTTFVPLFDVHGTTTTTTATTALHHTTLRYTQLQLQLRYTTPHPAVVGRVTTATIATTLKKTTPTTCRSISGFALPSGIHNNQPLL